MINEARIWGNKTDFIKFLTILKTAFWARQWAEHLAAGPHPAL
jgi:hypothetical protein